MDSPNAAQNLIKSLDLTSLHHEDTEEVISDLCQRATTPYGTTASVCIYPEFIRQAKHELPQGILIATVVNFPEGNADIKNTEKEIKQALKFGADEIDAVLPYRNLIQGDADTCRQFVQMCRQTCGNKTLKIIIESGELKSTKLIKQASQICIDEGADFIKTSTGKTPVSATPEAANAILEVIKANNTSKVGFKASGGIKTTEDAKKYLTLAEVIMGSGWAEKSHFRIGASSVLTDLLKTIKQGY